MLEMKRHFLILFLFTLLLSNCFADGMTILPPVYTGDVFMPEQKAVIFWDGSKEELIIESKVTVEDITNIAWLIPIESSTKPTVEEADEQIFFDLADLFRPMPKGRGIDYFGIARSVNPEGVEVIEQISIDIYDITILKATDEAALINWLNSNGYAFPEAFPNLLTQYVRKGNTYFIANKINLQNKYPGISPSHTDFECAIEIIKDEYLTYRFYRFDIEELEARMPSILGDFAECGGANENAVTALVTLRLGIATPLKITFTPSKPYYPMLLSSLNVGQGNAIVYFVGNSPFRDESGLFATKNMRTLPTGFLDEYGISGSHITLLNWEDDYFRLDRDATFAQTAFDPTLDPNYVPPPSPWDIFTIIALMLLGLLLVAVIFAIPFLIIPFMIGYVVAYIWGQRKKKKTFFAQSNSLVGTVSAIVLILIGPLFFAMLFIMPSLIFSYSYVEFLPMLILTSIISFPYCFSMAFGFMFRRSNHKLRYLLGAIVAFLILVALLALLITGVQNIFGF